VVRLAFLLVRIGRFVSSRHGMPPVMIALERSATALRNSYQAGISRRESASRLFSAMGMVIPFAGEHYSRFPFASIKNASAQLDLPRPGTSLIKRPQNRSSRS
jgi:hypothetical protein